MQIQNGYAVYRPIEFGDRAVAHWIKVDNKFDPSWRTALAFIANPLDHSLVDYIHVANIKGRESALSYASEAHAYLEGQGRLDQADSTTEVLLNGLKTPIIVVSEFGCTVFKSPKKDFWGVRMSETVHYQPQFGVWIRARDNLFVPILCRDGILPGDAREVSLHHWSTMKELVDGGLLDEAILKSPARRLGRKEGF